MPLFFEAPPQVWTCEKFHEFSAAPVCVGGEVCVCVCGRGGVCVCVGGKVCVCVGG